MIPVLAWGLQCRGEVHKCMYEYIGVSNWGTPELKIEDLDLTRSKRDLLRKVRPLRSMFCWKRANTDANVATLGRMFGDGYTTSVLKSRSKET